MATHERTAVEEVEHDYESLPPNFSLSANMLAGAFAGIAEHSVMYPIDLLKTRMQVVNPSPTAVYTGISNAMITISRVEGFRTLWRGLSSVVLGAGPAHAVYFASYEAVKHAMGGNDGGKHEHHPLAAAVSGASATIASDALMNPFDVIKQRMQLHGSVYKSLGHCAKTVFRTEGFTAFYVSYPTTLCMTVPFTALQFMAYESISKTMNPTGRYDPYTHCTAGGLAGGFAAGFTTPLDVIKTLLQTRGSATEPELRNVSGLWQAATIIKRRDGYGGFFRGLKPRIITTMPSTAICWSAYEMAKAFFIARNEARTVACSGLSSGVQPHVYNYELLSLPSARHYVVSVQGTGHASMILASKQKTWRFFFSIFSFPANCFRRAFQGLLYIDRGHGGHKGPLPGVRVLAHWRVSLG